MVAIGERARFEFPSVRPQGNRHAKMARRPVYMGRTDAPVDCAVHYRDHLAPGAEIEGPALIQEYASTTVMFAGDRCKVAETGEIVITLGNA
jgi:N-methylhydantoinase A